MVTVSLRPAVPWAWHLLSPVVWIWFVLVQMTVEVKDRTVPLGNHEKWRQTNNNKKKGNKPLLTKARQHMWLRGPFSAFRNGWAVCHADGGKMKLPWFVWGIILQVVLMVPGNPSFVNLVFIVLLGSRKNILGLVINYPGGNNEMSWSSFGPASISNVAKSRKAKSWKEKNSSLSE